jgi:predicted NBD/HSP70 family sugar kinase
MEGDLYRGSHYRAGEFGVLPVGDQGEPMHEVASASGLMKACRRALAFQKKKCLTARSCLNVWRATASARSY